MTFVDLLRFRQPGERWEDLLIEGQAPIVDEALWDAASMGVDGWTLADAIRRTWTEESARD